MAPEILNKIGKYSEKVDVWSAGLIFYEILNLTSQVLFDGDSYESVKKKINNTSSLEFRSYVP
jgi:serine/threonine protein kinase